MTKHGADLLIERINETGNPSVVGLDPRIGSLPDAVKKEALDKYGDTIEGVCSAIVQFNKTIINNISDIVPAVKPQAAFYELYGAKGFEAFEETIKYAKQKGLVVVADCKRNDIGSTASAYAAGLLGESSLFESKTKTLDADWLTVNPYLGDDGLKPFIEACDKFGKGIFVLVKTSNPSSGQFQDRTFVETNTTLFETVAAELNKLAEEHKGNSGYSSVGAVVGATYPEQAVAVRNLIPSSYILVPGYGKQGGGAMDTVPCFNEDGYGAIVNSSRGVIFAYQDPSDENWAESVRKAALDMREDLRGALAESSKLPKGW